MINVIKWENKSLRIVFLLLTLSAAVLPGKVLVKSKWILFGKRIFEQKEGWERISAEEKHAHQERVLGND